MNCDLQKKSAAPGALISNLGEDGEMGGRIRGGRLIEGGRGRGGALI